MDAKGKVNWLFRNLRKRRLMAEQNFACCMSCAVSELSEMLDEDKKRSCPKCQKIGAVFYHRQDAQGFARTGHLYLGYIATEDGKEKQIGEIIVEEAKRLGIPIAWNGDASDRVLLKFEGD